MNALEQLKRDILAGSWDDNIGDLLGDIQEAIDYIENIEQEFEKFRKRVRQLEEEKNTAISMLKESGCPIKDIKIEFGSDG